ncbi:UTRA domain-containing protein [Streptomyces sp. NPDC001073]
MTSDDAWVGEAQPYLAPRAPGQADAWTSEAATRGRKGGQRLLTVEEVDPPAAVRAFFDTEAGEKVVVRRRLVLLDGEPVELADSYYPAAIARGTALAEMSKIPGGAVTLLADLGFPPADEVDEDVAPKIAAPEEYEALRLPAESAVLVLTRFTRSTTGQPTEVAVMTMARHLHYRQSRKGS